LLKNIELLRKIQGLDLDVDAIGNKEKDRAEGIKALELSMEELGGRVEELEALIGTLTSEKNDIEEKVRQNNEKITRDRERINDIKNDKQLKALNKEIKTAENSNKLSDMELSSLTEKINEKENELAESKDALNAKEEEIKSINDDMEKEKTESESVLKARSEEREKLINEIPSAILKKYETIRERRAGIGLIEVRDEACQGCFINIPPQLYLQVRRGGEELVTCPNCHRILYFDASTES
jgi:hypothetical protein